MLLPRLRETLTFFWQHLADLLWLLVPVCLPLLLLADYRLLIVHGGNAETSITDPVMLLPQLLASLFATALTIRYTAALRAGKPVTFFGLWTHALRATPALMAVQILAGVAIVGGLLLLILPGLFLMGTLLPAYVVTVQEGAGPISALKTAWARYRHQAWFASAGLCLFLSLLLVVLGGLESLALLLKDNSDAVHLVATSGLDMIGVLFAQLVAIFLVHFSAAVVSDKPA